MGVKLGDGGFRSHRAAYLARRDTFEDFLNGLAVDFVPGSRL
jgi:hypothetical protein